MEKKLKIAEFATLIGVTPKTVYKMIERGELITVSEKVNNRQTLLVLTTSNQVNEFREVYRKTQVNNGNYEDILTVNVGNEHNLNSEYGVKDSNNAPINKQVIDELMTLHNTYNDRLEKLNNELTTAKAQVLLLEDKEARNALYLNEINELRRDNEGLIKSEERLKTVNEQLEKGNEGLKKVNIVLLTAVVFLLLSLTVVITLNFANKKPAEVLETSQVVLKK